MDDEDDEDDEEDDSMEEVDGELEGLKKLDILDIPLFSFLIFSSKSLCFELFACELIFDIKFRCPVVDFLQVLQNADLALLILNVAKYFVSTIRCNSLLSHPSDERAALSDDSQTTNGKLS